MTQRTRPARASPTPCIIPGMETADLPPASHPRPSLRHTLAGWAAGRWASWRVAILLYLGYAAVRQLADPSYRSGFGGIDFGAHELGHLVFAFFGELPSVAGGTVLQLLIPIGAGALLYQKRDYFGICVAGAWLGLSLLGVAQYVADARTQELTLLGFSPDPIHDWEYLLGGAGLLEYDIRLAQLLRFLAAIQLLAAVTAGGYLCRLMILHRLREREAA